MPSNDELQTLRFRSLCDLRGRAQSISFGRRNGQPVLFLPREFDLAEELAPEREIAEQERFFVNLNNRERETWRKILSAQPIADIAREEGVQRATIYNRILGNSKGRGGMIRKNFWVLLWWRVRQRSGGAQ